MAKALVSARAMGTASSASAYARISGRRVRQGTQGFLKELASNAFTILHEFDNTELAMFLWGLSNAGYYLDDDDARAQLPATEWPTLPLWPGGRRRHARLTLSGSL